MIGTSRPRKCRCRSSRASCRWTGTPTTCRCGLRPFRKGTTRNWQNDKQRFGDESTQKDLSSITHVAKGKHIPPFLILHVADHPDTKGQSQRLLQVLQEAGIPASTYAAEGKNHTTLNDDLGTPDDKPTQALFEFLDGLLSAKSAEA